VSYPAYSITLKRGAVLRDCSPLIRRINNE